MERLEVIQDKSYGNIKRNQCKIKLNIPNISEEDVLSICNEYLPKAVIFYIYLDGREITDVANYTVVWAPNGNWEEANEEPEFKTHKLKIIECSL